MLSNSITNPLRFGFSGVATGASVLTSVATTGGVSGAVVGFASSSAGFGSAGFASSSAGFGSAGFASPSAGFGSAGFASPSAGFASFASFASFGFFSDTGTSSSLSVVCHAAFTLARSGIASKTSELS